MLTCYLLFAVSFNSRKPVTEVWLDTVYLCRDSSVEWGAVFWHHSTLGCYWLVADNLHGMSVVCVFTSSAVSQQLMYFSSTCCKAFSGTVCLCTFLFNSDIGKVSDKETEFMPLKYSIEIWMWRNVMCHFAMHTCGIVRFWVFSRNGKG